MLYVGLDLSRKRLDWHALLADGERVDAGACPPDSDGLAHLVLRLGAERPVLAAIESMNGARFVHDQLALAGWDVRIADAVRVKGLAPLACKRDRIDAWVLAELARRELIPEIWLPDPAVRAERERARFRLHLVKHRSSLKCRVHSLLFQHGLRSPIDDLFGAGGRRFLERVALPEPWRSTMRASLHLIDFLEEQIDGLEREPRLLAEATWWMLTRNQPFAPAGACSPALPVPSGHSIRPRRSRCRGFGRNRGRGTTQQPIRWRRGQ
jgi:transposase